MTYTNEFHDVRLADISGEPLFPLVESASPYPVVDEHLHLLAKPSLMADEINGAPTSIRVEVCTIEAYAERELRRLARQISLTSVLIQAQLVGETITRAAQAAGYSADRGKEPAVTFVKSTEAVLSRQAYLDGPDKDRFDAQGRLLQKLARSLGCQSTSSVLPGSYRLLQLVLIHLRLADDIRSQIMTAASSTCPSQGMSAPPALLGLSKSHLLAVVHLPKDLQLPLLQQATEERLSVREFRDHVRKVSSRNNAQGMESARKLLQTRDAILKRARRSQEDLHAFLALYKRLDENSYQLDDDLCMCLRGFTAEVHATLDALSQHSGDGVPLQEAV